MVLFTPKGEVAQWRIIYRMLQNAQVGEILPYERLADSVDMNAADDRPHIQAAARRAGKHLLRHDDRAIEVIPNVGYRVVPAGRQIALAGHQVERAGKSLTKGHELTTHVRLNELSPSERNVVHAMALGFAQVAEWARQIGRRVEDHEGRLTDVETELERLRKERNSA
jgi:hypothetical protein